MKVVVLNGSLLAVFLAFQTLTVGAQDPPSTPTLFLLNQGDSLEYHTYHRVDEDWFEPDVDTGWPTAPGGFGPQSRFAEISTENPFAEIFLRHRFSLNTAASSLSLALKHDALPFTAYLNGQLILNMDSSSLPLPDEYGFRHYDLSTAIPALPTDDNLLALHIEGAIAVPILTATISDPLEFPFAISATATRIAEGGTSAKFLVLPLSETSSITRIDVVTSTTSLSDFAILQDGNPVTLNTTSSGTTYFDAAVSSDSPAPIFELIALDDLHAEAQETIELLLHSTHDHPLRFVITRNDTAISTTHSSGEGSLAQAIDNADAFPGVETLTFSEVAGVPFFSSPTTIHLDATTGIHFALRQGFILEGPPSPGRVTLNFNGGVPFYISGAYSPESPALTLRNLVISGADTAVKSTRYSGTLLVENCEFLNNQTAIDSYSRLTTPVIRNCYFGNNSESSIKQRSGLPPRVENCTFTANSGTMMDLDDSSTIEHCTFTGSNLRFISGRVRLRNCLFSGLNSDFKIINSDTDQGGNLFASETPSGFPIHPQSKVIPAGSAAIGILGFHGGFTRSIPILPDSPALDLGIPSNAESTEFDQRATPFLRQVGLAPDAGAYELQLNPQDIVIGALTDPSYDIPSGIYYQLAVIHNDSPWTLSGFRLQVGGLPADSSLYNASGPGFVDVAGPIPASGQIYIILQYLADRPDLILNPVLTPILLPNSDLPEAPAMLIPASALVWDESSSPCIYFRSKPGTSYQVEVSDDLIHWSPGGPPVFSGSQHLWWKDPDTIPRLTRYYRVAELN